ncbi:hypothetical protein CJ030_MR6G021585 [Morella rubra]|uniref:Uncharacterized protein n=1 Tax=Morella rubra TaxID=262757 RepID=A0A6A1VFA4_9ROSI|nr:hypothetical protein CJ030_MR6G021585 [Morella rubra]
MLGKHMRGYWENCVDAKIYPLIPLILRFLLIFSDYHLEPKKATQKLCFPSVSATTKALP